MNKKLAKILFVGSGMLILTGCGGDAETNNSTITSQPTSGVTEQAVTFQPQPTQLSSRDEFIEHQLELGTYEGNIALNGEERHQKVPTLKENHFVFPQGTIRSITTSLKGKEESFLDVSNEEIEAFVEEVENAKVESMEKIEDKSGDDMEFVEADVTVTLLNSEGEFVSVCLTAAIGNRVYLKVYKEGLNDSDDWKKELLLDWGEYRIAPNKELTKMIKQLSGYRIVENKELQNISKVKVNNKAKEKEFSLKPKEVTKFKQIISSAKWIPDSMPGCDFRIIVSAKTKTGDTISMRIATHGEGCLAIEGGLYEIKDDKVKRQLSKLMQDEKE